MKVILTEIKTVYLFEMPCIAVERTTDEGISTESENNQYTFLTFGKGRNRKMLTVETQTINNALKTKFTTIPKLETSSRYTFAAMWDMCDAFEKNKGTSSMKNNTKLPELSDNQLNSSKNVDIHLSNNVLIVERVLASNIFRIKQEYFKGLMKSKKQTENFTLIHLWSFVSNEIQNMAVTDMCWNKKNSDILAISYGKYFYIEKQKPVGIVGIWNIKNPVQPERIYKFTSPVTCIDFSSVNPKLLAVGFYNGDILILDITKNNKNIISRSNKIIHPSHKPIWHIYWLSTNNQERKEYIITAEEDGIINKFTQTKTRGFSCKQIMKLNYTVELAECEQKLKIDSGDDITHLKRISCLVLCFHPTVKDIYFIGTMKGYIYVCSINIPNHHIDVFQAHNGPIYTIQFSHLDTFYITSGSDWMIKIWKDGIKTPLIILNVSNSVQSVSFCPTYYTVVAAISNKNIYLWNLKHSNFAKLPSEIQISPEIQNFTKLVFSTDGKNLIIGDIKGGTHIYNLSNILHYEDLALNNLEDSILQVLVLEPDLLEKVKCLTCKRENVT